MYATLCKLQRFPEVTGHFLCAVMCRHLGRDQLLCCFMSKIPQCSLWLLGYTKTSSCQEAIATYKTDMAKNKRLFVYLLFQMQNNLQDSSTSCGDPGSRLTAAGSDDGVMQIISVLLCVRCMFQKHF